MKFLSKSLVLGCTLFAFGCVDSDPEYKAEKARQRAEYSKESSNLAKAEFSPLLPVCLNKLERGVASDPAQMAKLGYKKQTVSLVGKENYVKPRGSNFSDRVNMKNTTLVLHKDRCSFGLGNYASVQEGGTVLRELLKAHGYKYTTNIGGSKFIFEKGSSRLALTGFFYSSATHYTLEKTS